MKQQSRAQRPDIPPHPLVDPGNPPHSPTSRAKTNSTCRHHRMVALAAGSSSRSTEISYQTKITAVMLGHLSTAEKDRASCAPSGGVMQVSVEFLGRTRILTQGREIALSRQSISFLAYLVL